MGQVLANLILPADLYGERDVEVSHDNYGCAEFCHVFCCMYFEGIVLGALTIFILQLNSYRRQWQEHFVYYTMF